MKCGTSTLHEQLALRSGFCMSTPKEPNFFSDDAHYAKGLAAYAALFANAKPQQLCGESSTHYTKLPTYPQTVARMHAALPKLKLIYILRDPLQRIESQYIHEWSRREVEGAFAQAVAKHERFIAYSCYARQLEPFVRAYGALAILPIFFERMLSFPDETLARVCAFLGDPSPEPVAWNTTLGVQNSSSERMRMSKWRDRLLSLPGVTPLKNRLPQSLRDEVKKLWQMRQRPVWEPALRKRAAAEIDADLARLGAWFGLQLDCANWQQQVLAPPCPSRSAVRAAEPLADAVPNWKRPLEHA